MISARQNIVDAVAARLALISTANGYDSNIGGKVFVWRKTPVTLQETPCICIFDTTADSSVLAYPKRDHRLTIAIECLVSDRTTASQARAMANDIYKAIGVDETFSGLALKSDLNGHEIEIAPAGDTTGAVKIMLEVTYRTDLWRI